PQLPTLKWMYDICAVAHLRSLRIRSAFHDTVGQMPSARNPREISDCRARRRIASLLSARPALGGALGTVLGAVLATGCGFPRPQVLPADASVAFAVVSTEPAAHAASVDPGTPIRVTFSTALGSSVPQFAVTTADGALAGSVSVDGAVLSFH